MQGGALFHYLQPVQRGQMKGRVSQTPWAQWDFWPPFTELLSEQVSGLVDLHLLHLLVHSGISPHFARCELEKGSRIN